MWGGGEAVVIKDIMINYPLYDYYSVCEGLRLSKNDIGFVLLNYNNNNNNNCLKSNIQCIDIRVQWTSCNYIH